MTENNPSVNSSPGRRDDELLARQLAEARADEGGDGQLGRLVVDAGQRGQCGPATEVLDPEQGERLTDGADLAAQAEEGGVDVAQQTQAERDIAGDQRLDVGELDCGIVERGDDLQHGQAVGRDPARDHDGWTAEEVALEEVGAGADAELVVGVGAHLLGQHRAGKGAQAAGQLVELLAAELEHAELDHVEELERQLALRLIAEVVQSELKALGLELAQRGEDLLVFAASPRESPDRPGAAGRPGRARRGGTRGTR